jgi:hypothetical protein
MKREQTAPGAGPNEEIESRPHPRRFRKRHRSAALQKLRYSNAPSNLRQVLECGAPVPLFRRKKERQSGRRKGVIRRGKGGGAKRTFVKGPRLSTAQRVE